MLVKKKSGDKMRIPKHIGIIPDGNRRWALKEGMGKEAGYNYGLHPGLQLLRIAKEYGVQEITYYGFTMDNCKRPKEQFAAFQKACVDAVNIISSEGADLLVIGNVNSACFPQELLPYMTRTKIHGGKIKVNFLVNYGWKWDLSNLYTAGNIYSADISRIDLIIRWGGMHRLSGFLPVQSVYADFYIENNLWPDYTDEDFTKALIWYDRQDVTLGG
jgi:undecaprenyl diphosphate synthase